MIFGWLALWGAVLLKMGTLLSSPMTEKRGWIVEHLPVDITGLVKDVSQRATGLASAKSQQLEVPSEAEPMWVLGDGKLLRRLLSILIDNAVKYTPDGGAIRVRLKQQVDDTVHLSVQDTGIGISSELLPKIFDRFYRADVVRDRKSGGFGLGLAIARWIAVVHSAEINVSSLPHQGSTFTVRFSRYMSDMLPSTTKSLEPELTIG
jgi:two-component system, OmpR family, heavy metal sensor histidine kinase CusS